MNVPFWLPEEATMGIRGKLLTEVVAKSPITFKVPCPPSVNKLYGNNKLGKGRGRYKTKEYQYWECHAWARILEQKVKTAKPFEEVHVIYQVPYHKTAGRKGKKDNGNYEKAISDFLSKCGIIKDDSRIDFNIKGWTTDSEMIVNIWPIES
jgi:Holliday junction resolvase RusA-like endonuclease